MPSVKHCQTFPLRIPASTRANASEMAKRQSISLNYFILVAVAERIERMKLTHPDNPDKDSSAIDIAAQIIAIDKHL